MYMDFEMNSVIRHHMKIFNFLGFCTISLDNRHNWQRVEKFLLTWSVISMITFMALTVGTFLYQDNFYLIGHNFEEFNITLKLTCVAVAYQVSVIEAMLSREQDRCFWTKYRQLQKRISQKFWKKSSDRYRYFLFCFYGYLAIKFVFEVSFGVAVRLRRQLLLNWIICTPITLVTALRTMQIILYIELIRTEVGDLNLRLIALRRRSKRLRGAALKVEFQQINQLMVTYQLIHEMTEHFKAACGWSMAANFTKSYIIILVDFYLTFFLMYHEDEHVEWLLLIPAIVEMGLPLVISRNGMREATYTSYHVHRLRHPVEMFRFSLLIENFSLQILHQKLEINAFGLFIFDCKLLKKVLGSTAVYMLFFIQFLPKFKSNDKTFLNVAIRNTS